MAGDDPFFMDAPGKIAGIFSGETKEFYRAGFAEFESPVIKDVESGEIITGIFLTLNVRSDFFCQRG